MDFDLRAISHLDYVNQGSDSLFAFSMCRIDYRAYCRKII